MRGDETVGEFGDGSAEEGTKSSGAEFHAEDAGLAFEHADEFVSLDTGDDGCCVFEDQVDVGMGQAFGGVGSAATQVPIDDPVVRDPGRDFGRGAAAGVAEISGGQSAAQHSASAANFGIEDLFDPGSGFLSRFSNHWKQRRVRVAMRSGTMKVSNSKSGVRADLDDARTTAKKILNGAGVAIRGMAVAAFVLGVCSFIHAQGGPGSSAPAQSIPVQKEARMTKHASGTFDVKVTPQKADNKEAETSKLGRMSLDKQFHGDMEGSSAGEMLSAMSEVKGSGGYVAMERLKVTLNGRSGTFVLLHSGTMVKGTPQMWSVTVVPDSGTEDLVGISGTMTIKIEGKNHSYEFEYLLGE